MIRVWGLGSKGPKMRGFGIKGPEIRMWIGRVDPSNYPKMGSM